ncbi:MAG: carboxypeptidase regulatory-like domain-containing protein [Bacteroidetes bacterium]|nr:carboxypeptidase regulatory-like domain-containing protein [Bacteroidota bacterium]
MKKQSLLVIFAILIAISGYSQTREPKAQRMVTTFEKSTEVEFQPGKNIPQTLFPVPAASPLTPSLNWQATDAAAIDNCVKVSSQSQKTAAGWGLNNQRLSLYGSSNVPDWEVPFTISGWDEVIDMTEDGTRIVNGVNDQVEIYGPGSALPVWAATLSRTVRGVQIRNDGQQVFVAAVNQATQDSSFIYCFNVGQGTPAWVKSFAGNYTALVLSKSGNRLLLGEYGGVNNKLFVLNTATGAQIFQTVFADQYPPAISDDGKYIVSGDFSGHVFLLEYSETAATYSERWNYTVNGASTWVAGMGISGDGSTIAVGTLIFTAAGGYDGELYVFNNYSPVPLWIYPNMGDMVQCVDLSSDGSVIAAAGWGPVNNSSPDILLFRKQSNVPFLSVNSPGSNFCLDLSADGKQCVAGGKAIHARAFGSGGKLFNISSDPGGGTLGGLAVKSGATQQAGVRVEIVGMSDYFTFSNESSAYVLKYIPAGTYTVHYRAAGYITRELTGVVIADGQVTTRDVTLDPAGIPASNLTATQGASLNVDLHWQPSPSPGITGYNIYRKQYAFDFYPSAPLGTVGAGQFTYTDNTALPLTHYFYTVTAQLPGLLETPYSNDAEGWTATGFITSEISAWVGSTPVIDGVINPGEWSDAFEVDISNFLGRRDNILRPVGSVMAWFKVNAAKTSLYVAVDNTYDAVLEDHDEIALYVDDNNDGVYPAPGDSTEGNYWAAHYASGDVIKFRPIYNNGGVGSTFYLPAPQIKVSAATGHVVYEFAIPLGTASNWQLGFNSQSQSGIFIFGLDDPANYDGWWPCLNQNIFTAEGYGVITFGAVDGIPPPPLNLALVNPVAQDIMLLWDQPQITDFDHFNIYWSTDGGITFPILDSTIGVQYFLTVPSNGLYKFYVTTVDRAGHESVPSNIVGTNVVIGITEQGMVNGLTMVKMGPNPFNRQLDIDFKLPGDSRLTIRVFDINGQQVNTLYDSEISAGRHHIAWNGYDRDGNELSPGIYMVRFCTANGNPVSVKVVRSR